MLAGFFIGENWHGRELARERESSPFRAEVRKHPVFAFTSPTRKRGSSLLCPYEPNAQPRVFSIPHLRARSASEGLLFPAIRARPASKGLFFPSSSSLLANQRRNKYCTSMMPPLAYFLTWTCHGSWMHGDERGSVDKDHNKVSTPLLPVDAARVAEETSLMCGHGIRFDPQSRDLVEATIRRHCEIRRWKLYAVAVRTNHVHVVVCCGENTPPESAMEQFKAWSTRALRDAKIVDRNQGVWTSHGSTRWINHQPGLDAAVAYVLTGQ